MLPGKVTGYVVQVAEEALILQNSYDDIDITLSYSEKAGDVELLCESTGSPFNPLEEGALEDMIGLNIIGTGVKVWITGTKTEGTFCRQ